jgi:TetR/AcrR family fatty acid metabolism transcriptional regulator
MDPAFATAPSSGKVDAILAAAMELFGRKGFENTPVSAIAEKAGVAGGTIIYHFKSKDNLLFILARQILYSIFKHTRAAVHEAATPEKALHAYVRAFFHYVDQNPDAYRVLLKTDPMALRQQDRLAHVDLEVFYSRQQTLLEDVLKQGVESGDFPPMPVKQSARVLFGMVSYAARAAVQGQDKRHALRKEVETWMHCRFSSGENPHISKNTAHP